MTNGSGEHRVILHSDCNCYYASVEMMLNPSLRGKAMAVCGLTEDRHGIVLAKSYEAKDKGVKTGMVNFKARQACPGLICVPPHYDEYLKYSALVRNIYERYADKNKVRSYYAMCDPAHTFVNVDKCVVYEKLAMAEKQLKTKRDGINRSLGKVTRMKRSLEKCVAKSGMQSEEATALATKLYAMADELPSLIGMQLAA